MILLNSESKKQKGLVKLGKALNFKAKVFGKIKKNSTSNARSQEREGEIWTLNITKRNNWEKLSTLTWTMEVKLRDTIIKLKATSINNNIKLMY